MKGRNVVLVFLFFILAVLVYSFGLRIPYYADDFQYVFTDPSQAVFHYFLNQNHLNPFYRPIQTMILAILQSIWGWDTVMLRLLHLLLHACLAMLIFRALRTWAIGTSIACLGAVYFIIAQMNAAAVLGNDTTSQVTGTLFFLLTLWLFYRYKTEDAFSWDWKYIASIATFFLALLSKETSAGLILAVSYLSFIYTAKPKRPLRVAYELAPYIAFSILYWLLRSNAGGMTPQFGEGQYASGIGTNVLVNIGLFVVQSILPVSSYEVARFTYDGRHAPLAAVALFTGLFGATMLYGLWKGSHKRLSFGLGVLTFLSWIPMIFLGHVSEQYVYGSAPFVAALVAIALQYYWVERRRLIKFVAPIFFFVCLCNIIGVITKSGAMKEQGDRAMILLRQVSQVARNVPPGSRVYVVHPSEKQFYYSLYSLKGFTSISWSEHLLRHMAQRPDITLLIVDSAAYVKAAGTYPGPAFTYDPRTLALQPFPPK